MNYRTITNTLLIKNHFLTKEGLDELKAELDQLRLERIKIRENLKTLDPQDINDYIMSTDEIKMIQMNEEHVDRILDILKYTNVLNNEENTNTIRLGSNIMLRLKNKLLRFRLVDSIEADPFLHKISDESRVGRALLGKKPHEKIRIVDARGHRYSYEVLAIA